MCEVNKKERNIVRTAKELKNRKIKYRDAREEEVKSRSEGDEEDEERRLDY